MEDFLKELVECGEDKPLFPGRLGAFSTHRAVLGFLMCASPLPRIQKDRTDHYIVTDWLWARDQISTSNHDDWA